MMLTTSLRISWGAAAVLGASSMQLSTQSAALQSAGRDRGHGDTRRCSWRGGKRSCWRRSKWRRGRGSSGSEYRPWKRIRVCRTKWGRRNAREGFRHTWGGLWWWGSKPPEGEGGGPWRSAEGAGRYVKDDICDWAGEDQRPQPDARDRVVQQPGQTEEQEEESKESFTLT